MRVLSFLLVASFAVTSQASANFKSTCNIVSAQMSNLDKSILQIRQVASGLGHKNIMNQCDQARGHLGVAQSSWNGISSSFSSYPWQARSSPHANVVKQRMSSCGSSLNWIYRQPELRNPLYGPHVDNCRNNYNWCNSGCNSVWNWPSPPGYNPPRPSNGNQGYYRRPKRSTSVCPVNESACPISHKSEGFECLDTQTEITSCGGCVTEGKGENCLSIVGAEGVGCLQGSCVVLSLKPGYTKNELGRPVLVEA